MSLYSNCSYLFCPSTDLHIYEQCAKMPNNSEIEISSFLILIQNNGKTYVAVHVNAFGLNHRKIIMAGTTNNPNEDFTKATMRKAKEVQGFIGVNNEINVLKTARSPMITGPDTSKLVTLHVYVTSATTEDFDWTESTKEGLTERPTLIKSICEDCFPLGGADSHIYAVEVNALLTSHVVSSHLRFVILKAKDNGFL